MKGQAYINGKDIFTEFGAVLRRGAYEALLLPAPTKPNISNQSRKQNGERVICIKGEDGKVFSQKREFQLQIFIQGRDTDDYLRKYESFIDEIRTGVFDFIVPRLRKQFRLVYINCPKYGDYGLKCGNFALRLEEPNPENRQIEEKYLSL